ncbi:GAF domain-containing protein [Streptomyces sp. NPDC096354]|uniref:GAF domain-containing protein n=1 Tax=Streptomyces sp. NPDC096354 TaxID=3366088 RepID=UPI0037F63449
MTTTAYDESDIERRLLQSIVEVARHIFGSAAASIFLIDPISEELVFEAVAGEGNEKLVGRRFPAGTGIAGFVAASGQTMLMDDLRNSAQFASDAAKSTDYMPRSIVAAPLFSGDSCIGVLEVLDRKISDTPEFSEIDTLTILANQAALALELLTCLGANERQASRRVVQLLDQARDIMAKLHG